MILHDRSGRVTRANVVTVVNNAEIYCISANGTRHPRNFTCVAMVLPYRYFINSASTLAIRISKRKAEL